MLFLNRGTDIEFCHFEAQGQNTILLWSYEATVDIVSSTFVLTEGQSIEFSAGSAIKGMRSTIFTGDGTINVHDDVPVERVVEDNNFSGVHWRFHSRGLLRSETATLHWQWRNNYGEHPKAEGTWTPAGRFLPTCEQPEITGCNTRFKCHDTDFGVRCLGNECAVGAINPPACEYCPPETYNFVGKLRIFLSVLGYT